MVMDKCMFEICEHLTGNVIHRAYFVHFLKSQWDVEISDETMVDVRYNLTGSRLV